VTRGAPGVSLLKSVVAVDGDEICGPTRPFWSMVRSSPRLSIAVVTASVGLEVWP
jgi:hypothetical protein